jgi:hypothetical protein
MPLLKKEYVSKPFYVSCSADRSSVQVAFYSLETFHIQYFDRWNATGFKDCVPDKEKQLYIIITLLLLIDKCAT